MDAPFLRIEDALKTCESHLKIFVASDPTKVEIESYFVSAMTLLIVSEYEQLIESIFGERADLSGDKHVSSFVKSFLARRFRSPDLRKILEVLSYFGEDYKNDFAFKVINTELHAAWDNIVQARHAIVHKSGSLNLTFSELTGSYQKTKKVIEELKKSLGLA